MRRRKNPNRSRKHRPEPRPMAKTSAAARAAAPLDRYPRFVDVAARFGVSVPTIRNWIAKGLFPRPITLGPNTLAFERNAVLAWEAARLAAGTNAPVGGKDIR